MLLQLQIQIKIYYKSVFHSFHSQMLLVWLRNFCLIVSVTLIYLPCFYFYFEPRQDSFVKKFMEKCIFLLHVFVLVFPIPSNWQCKWTEKEKIDNYLKKIKKPAYLINRFNFSKNFSIVKHFGKPTSETKFTTNTS